MRKSYEKISPTAKLVAYLRTFTDIPYAKEIAVESGAKKTFRELAGESKESMVLVRERLSTISSSTESNISNVFTRLIKPIVKLN
jgi:hypothetical protein